MTDRTYNGWSTYETWLVLEPPPIDHRETCIGALESKIVKDFKNWMINNPRLMLNHRRIGQYRWYITIGAPCAPRRKAQQGECYEDK